MEAHGVRLLYYSRAEREGAIEGEMKKRERSNGDREKEEGKVEGSDRGRPKGEREGLRGVHWCVKPYGCP